MGRRPVNKAKKPGQIQPEAVNGFTMLEVLLVLLIVGLLIHCFGGIRAPDRLNLFARNLLGEIQIEQYQALYHRQSRQIAVETDHIETEDRRVAYPKSITCEAQVIRFNEKGNISKGGTVRCQQGDRQARLVFQLGAGRGRIDPGE